MIVFDGQAILLDVEGTTSSISFVHDVLFSFAKKHFLEFVSRERAQKAVRDAAETLAAETGVQASLDAPEGLDRLTKSAIELMDRDVKSTPLKALQGMIWRSGFESGELVSHVFDDVPPALSAWADSGLDVRIYSSGSIEAQKLFFAHTSAGNLTPYLRGHYDTTTGPKREASSYTRIAADIGLEPRRILFISDIAAELDAARQAGMATALAVRPGNRDADGLFDHAPLASFAEIVT